MSKNWKEILLGLCTLCAVTGLSANDEPAEHNESGQVSTADAPKDADTSSTSQESHCSTCAG